jgi:hypothetical protein
MLQLFLDASNSAVNDVKTCAKFQACPAVDNNHHAVTTPTQPNAP